MLGLAFCLCIILYGLFLFTGKRQADRIDEAIRVKVIDSGSSQINPEARDQ